MNHTALVVLSSAQSGNTLLHCYVACGPQMTAAVVDRLLAMNQRQPMWDPIPPNVQKAGVVSTKSSTHIPKHPANSNSYSYSFYDSKMFSISTVCINLLISVSEMCVTYTTGSVKHLLCSHISGRRDVDERCDDSHCLGSANHAQWGCTHGRRRGCPACIQGPGACGNHHSCYQKHRFEERFTHVVNRLCADCERRR
jgi:hypothetical protein